jgi:hypothetical protein
MLSAMTAPGQPPPEMRDWQVSSVYQKPARRAIARSGPGRLWFWAFAALQVLGRLVLAGAGAQQTYDLTFDILGILASADVIIAITFAAWRVTSPNPEGRPGSWRWQPDPHRTWTPASGSWWTARHRSRSSSGTGWRSSCGSRRPAPESDTGT